MSFRPAFYLFDCKELRSNIENPGLKFREKVIQDVTRNFEQQKTDQRLTPAGRTGLIESFKELKNTLFLIFASGTTRIKTTGKGEMIAHALHAMIHHTKGFKVLDERWLWQVYALAELLEAAKAENSPENLIQVLRYMAEGRSLFPNSKTGGLYGYIYYQEAVNALPQTFQLLNQLKRKKSLGLVEFMEDLIIPVLKEATRNKKDLFIFIS